jgi:hypothetical protein
MLSRMIRSYGRRVGEGDEIDLARMLQVCDELDKAVQDAVDGQRNGPLKASWAYIAQATGKSRQAAYQRWGKPADRPPASS